MFFLIQLNYVCMPYFAIEIYLCDFSASLNSTFLGYILAFRILSSFENNMWTLFPDHLFLFLIFLLRHSSHFFPFLYLATTIQGHKCLLDVHCMSGLVFDSGNTGMGKADVCPVLVLLLESQASS